MTMSFKRHRRMLNQYQNTALESAVLSATPHRRVTMLYEAAIRHTRLAKMAVEMKNIEHKSANTSKAMNIISGLRAMLDTEAGGELGAQLDSLYDFIIRHLFEASKENSADKYATVIELLETLLDGWQNMPESYQRMSDQDLRRMRHGLAS